MPHNEWVTTPCNFAGVQMRMSFYGPHLQLRWKERKGKDFSVLECAKYTASFFEDPRLHVILERVPDFSHVALYIESAQTVFFFQKRTKYDFNEIKINTLYPLKNGGRVLVERDDYCYILPEEGKLRFGKERKFFTYKTK